MYIHIKKKKKKKKRTVRTPAKKKNCLRVEDVSPTQEKQSLRVRNTRIVFVNDSNLSHVDVHSKAERKKKF
jgi:hypothetical protein